MEEERKVWKGGGVGGEEGGEIADRRAWGGRERERESGAGRGH